MHEVILRNYAILLSAYVKAPPSGVLLVACILETDSNYGNMTSKLIPNESAPSASEKSGRNRLHFTGESVVLVLLDEQKRRPWPHRSLQCLRVRRNRSSGTVAARLLGITAKSGTGLFR